MNAKAKEIIKNIAESTTSRIKVEQLCEAIYRELEKAGIRCAIVNYKGIDIEGEKRDWLNSGTFVKKFRSVHDMYRRYYFTVDEVDRLVKFVKYDRVHQIDVLGGSEAYKEQVRMFRKRGEAMTEGFWTKCWEVEK